LARRNRKFTPANWSTADGHMRSVVPDPERVRGRARPAPGDNYGAQPDFLRGQAVDVAQQELSLPAFQLDNRRAAGQPFRVVLAADADILVGRQRTGERRSPASAPLDGGQGGGCPFGGEGLIQPGKLPRPGVPDADG
jgi:hypothetical protein